MTRCTFPRSLSFSAPSLLGYGSKHKLSSRRNRKKSGELPELFPLALRISRLNGLPTRIGGEKMRIRARAFPALLALAVSTAAMMAPKPVMASDEGHFDRTLAVSGPVDLDVQTGSGEITVRVGDSAKVEVHGR